MNARSLPIPPPADRGELAQMAPATVALRALHDLLMQQRGPVTTGVLARLTGSEASVIRRRLRQLEALDLAVDWQPISGSPTWTGVRRAPLDLVPCVPQLKPVLPVLTRWTSTERLAAQLGLPVRYARRLLLTELDRHVLDYAPDTDRWRLASPYRPE